MVSAYARGAVHEALVVVRIRCENDIDCSKCSKKRRSHQNTWLGLCKVESACVLYVIKAEIITVKRSLSALFWSDL